MSNIGEAQTFNDLILAYCEIFWALLQVSAKWAPFTTCESQVTQLGYAQCKMKNVPTSMQIMYGGPSGRHARVCICAQNCDFCAAQSTDRKLTTQSPR